MWIWITVGVAVAVSLGAFSGFGYRWAWTGFGETPYSKPKEDREVQPGKTLWDWLGLDGLQRGFYGPERQGANPGENADLDGDSEAGRRRGQEPYELLDRGRTHMHGGYYDMRASCR